MMPAPDLPQDLLAVCGESRESLPTWGQRAATDGHREPATAAATPTARNNSQHNFGQIPGTKPVASSTKQ